MRKLLAALLALLAVAPAAAQLPDIQDLAVWGRIGSPAADGGSGPSQAVPFATLFANTPINALQLSSLVQIAGGTVLGNNTGSLANVIATTAPLLGVPGTTVGSVCLANLTSGTVCVNPATGALGTAVATLPAGTYNIVGDSLTQTLTNKTFNCANQTSCVVRLGSDVTGTLLAANFGALTGDVTNSAGSYATTISAAAVTYAKMQNVTASRLLGNPTGSPTSPSEISLGATLAFSGTALQTAALTGDVTASANSFATTIAANAVSNAKMATMAANTVKANATGGSATPTDVTAATARSSSLLNVDQFTGHGDSNYSILTTDRTVGTNAAFTASRTWTLPAANGVNPGQEIIVADFQGTVGATNTLIIQRAGADTVNGATSVTITAANGAYLFKSDGVSKWTAQSMGAATGGGVTSVTCGTGLTGGTITTSGTCAVNLTTASNTLGGDINLNNTANYFDGPSMAQGTSGTWFASGQVTVIDTAGGANIYCKLWDGTTIIASGAANIGVANGYVSIALSGTLVTPANNIRISCKDITSTSGKIQFNHTGNSADSSIYGHRIN